MTSDSWKRRPRSPETKKAIAKSMRGKKNAKKPAEKKRAVICSSVSRQTKASLAQFCTKTGTTLSAVVDMAIVAFLKKE